MDDEWTVASDGASAVRTFVMGKDGSLLKAAQALPW